MKGRKYPKGSCDHRAYPYRPDYPFTPSRRHSGPRCRGCLVGSLPVLECVESTSLGLSSTQRDSESHCPWTIDVADSLPHRFLREGNGGICLLNCELPFVA